MESDCELVKAEGLRILDIRSVGKDHIRHLMEGDEAKIKELIRMHPHCNYSIKHGKGISIATVEKTSCTACRTMLETGAETLDYSFLYYSVFFYTSKCY